jgi:flagellar biosynthesis/type III secretory pathway M-ring protein FliF/YscJ
MKKSTFFTYKSRMKLYLEFAKKTGQELLGIKKSDTTFQVENSLFAYRKWLLQKGKSENYSDISSIGILAALGFLFVVFLAFIKGVIDELKNRNKKPKTSVNKAKNEDTKDRELSREDSEGDGLFFGDPPIPPEFDED